MTRAAGVPWRPLAALTAGVLAAHWLALRGVPQVLSWERPTAPAKVLLAVVPLASVPQPRADSVIAPAPPVEARAVDTHAVQPATPRPSAAPAKVVARAAAPSRPASPARTTAAAPATAAAPPAVRLPAAAVWQFVATALHRGVPLRGSAQLAWESTGGEYEAVLQVNVPRLPARVQRSVGAVTPDGLAPTRFSDRARTEEATHFERGQGRIVFSSNRPDAVLQAGAQDRVSVLLQLAALAAADPNRMASGTVVAVQTAGTREAERWDWVVDGVEGLDLPGGKVDAVKLTRAPQREYDLRLELWLGPGPDYAPVRLRLTPPNGDWLDLQWSGTDKR